MKRLVGIIFFIFTATNVFSQDSNNVRLEKQKYPVYRIRPLVNGPLIVGGLVANYFGLKSIRNKPPVDPTIVLKLTPEDVNKFDRGAARQNPSHAHTSMSSSDLTLRGAGILTLVLLFDKKIRKDVVNYSVVFLTTLSVMSNAYAWGAGHINRYRPYVYNIHETAERRTKSGSQDSFYSGHVASTAACTFFIAKAYHDYHPNSKLTPYLFVAASVPPMMVGYMRYRSGMHFPTDIIAGYVSGAVMGIVIPQLHKVKNKNLSFYPYFSPRGGLSMTLDF